MREQLEREDYAIVRKYWLSGDGQADIGAWPLDTPDEEIWRELKDNGHDGTGSIEIGDWRE